MTSRPPKYPHTFSAAQVIATNEDLLVEILSRLPVRPLLRFKCVSKLWRSLISSTQFSHVHTRRYRSHVSAIFVHTSPGLVDPHYQFVPTLYDEIPSGSPFDSLDFVQDPAGIKILQSCNGLLLCCSLRKSYSSRKFYVYNPSTNQFSTLTPPLTCVANKSTPILGLTLAFDPSKSPYYKIVCVRSSAVSVYHDQIEIYSSGTRTWRSSGSAFVAPFDMAFDDGVFWNGAVHWISPTGFNALYFNVERECFGEMPRLPVNEGWASCKFRYLGESGDHLHLIEIHGPCATQFEVLELKKDYSKWFVKYKVDLQALADQFPEMTLNYFDHFSSLSCALVVLFLAREDHRNDKDASLLLHISGKVISYNLKDKTFRKLCDLAPHGTQAGTCPQFGLPDAFQYIETLASV